MGLTPKQQVKELINKSNQILIATHQSFNGDGLGAALALSFLLEKLHKKSEIVIPSPIPAQLKFLPNLDKFHLDLQETRDFICQIDTSQNKISQLRYENENDKLNIYLTPQNGTIRPEDVKFIPGKHKFDLAIILDSPDLDQLGRIYEKNTELFFDIPIINIDHHASNEYFGEVNLIEVTATSTCEIVYTLLDTFGNSFLDEKTAVSLLTGIIADTESFQSPTTTPRAFTIAASLIAAGANQQEIIKHLYKTKALPVLKLWGRIMSRLQYDTTYKLVWSIVGREDFNRSGSKPEDLTNVLRELKENTPNADAILLIKEMGDHNFEGTIQVIKNINKTELAEFLSGTLYHEKIDFSLPSKDLTEAENFALKKFRDFRANLQK
jgi:nanoRNase/pAp phosphatase (c-di-AMP/oligoRNAs hydrolase)